MSNTDTKPTVAGKIRDFVGAARESILVIVFVLLLLNPERIKDVLVRAGFTELSFAGIKWQNQLIAANREAEAAKETVAEVSASLDEAKRELRAIAVRHPGAREDIGRIAEDLSKVENRARAADETLNRSITVQRKVLREIAPERMRIPPDLEERRRRVEP